MPTTPSASIVTYIMVNDHLRAVSYHYNHNLGTSIKLGSNLVRSFEKGNLSSWAFAFGKTEKSPNFLVSSFRAGTLCKIENPLRIIGCSFKHKLARGLRCDKTSQFDLCCNEKPNMGGRMNDERVSAGCPQKVHCRQVKCQIQTISWRERRILASILVNTNEQTLWQVLTDYERLAEFIPNLVWSKRIPCPHPGRIWLLQRGIQRAMYWHIEAQVVLDLQELPNSENGKELHFFMVDGDFKRYEGKWLLQSGPRSDTTILHYEVNVIPRVFLPAVFVEKIIRSDLPVNLCALAERAEGIYNVPATDKTIQSVCTASGEKPDAKLNANHILEEEARNFDQPNKIKLDVPKPASESKETPILTEWGEGELLGARSQMLCKLVPRCLADEIHFRRLDDLLENGGVHRRVLATITVKAPPEEVWVVLTAYENLPEFVPNLANSKVISREGKKVRLIQEGYKCLLYMALHARVVLDLWEQPGYEIAFKQVEGDFDSFQGKWSLEPFGSHHTLMKYMVETRMHKDCVLSEAIVEEVVYEDLPSNLCAIRDRVEKLDRRTANFTTVNPENHSKSLELVSSHIEEVHRKARQGNFNSDIKSGIEAKRRHKRNSVALRLREDFGILEKELKRFIAKYGEEGVMPMRKFLRHHHRIDLEKAITAMGGFRAVAARLKLSLAYKRQKPKGYWDSLDNLKQEITDFQLENGLDREIMPTRRSIERQGRYDLARAFEKWGGLQEVARVLGLRRARENYD